PTDHSHQLADVRDEEPQPGHGQVDPQVQDELQEIDRDDQQPADPGQLVGWDEHDHHQHDPDRVLHLQHVPELGREREGRSRERERPDHGSPGEEGARSLADAPHRRPEHEDADHDVGREVVHVPRHVEDQSEDDEVQQGIQHRPQHQPHASQVIAAVLRRHSMSRIRPDEMAPLPELRQVFAEARPDPHRGQALRLEAPRLEPGRDHLRGFGLARHQPPPPRFVSTCSYTTRYRLTCSGQERLLATARPLDACTPGADSPMSASAIARARSSAEPGCTNVAHGVPSLPVRTSLKAGRSEAITGRPSARASTGFCGVTRRDTVRSRRGTTTVSSASTQRLALLRGTLPGKWTRSRMPSSEASATSPGRAVPSPTRSTWILSLADMGKVSSAMTIATARSRTSKPSYATRALAAPRRNALPGTAPPPSVSPTILRATSIST